MLHWKYYPLAWKHVFNTFSDNWASLLLSPTGSERSLTKTFGGKMVFSSTQQTPECWVGSNGNFILFVVRLHQAKRIVCINSVSAPAALTPSKYLNYTPQSGQVPQENTKAMRVIQRKMKKLFFSLIPLLTQTPCFLPNRVFFFSLLKLLWSYSEVTVQ